MSKVDLRLDWCSYEAAKFAVEHWHYSKCLPVGNSVKIGVWEDSFFIGCIIFSHGANKNISKPYGLLQTECVELTRVALNKHKTQVSKLVSISLKMLKKQSNGLRLVVSYADNEQGHFGGIYQAGNWIYTGETKLDALLVNGEKTHRKTIYSQYGYNSVERLRKTGLDVLWATGRPKYKYLFPLDDAMRKQIEPLRKPYPKRDSGEIDNAPQTNAETGGASPTESLSLEGIK